MVFILGRMGNAPRALCLIIDELKDIPQVHALHPRTAADPRLPAALRLLCPPRHG